VDRIDGTSANTVQPISPYSLAGKTILVTGASSGIGKACGLLAAELGAQVILSGRDAKRLDQTRLALCKPNDHLVKPLDLALDSDFGVWSESLPALDGVAHCAGVALLSPFRMLSGRLLDNNLNINLRSPLLLTKSLMSARRINAGGSLVFVGAVADHIAPQASAAYAASKAGLLAAVRSLALETARHSIRANCVSPGYVNTPMLASLEKSSSIDRLTGLAPLGLIEPEDIAASVICLLSPASRWVTRSSLIVDSGISIPVR